MCRNSSIHANPDLEYPAGPGGGKVILHAEISNISFKTADDGTKVSWFDLEQDVLRLKTVSTKVNKCLSRSIYLAS